MNEEKPTNMPEDDTEASESAAADGDATAGTATAADGGAGTAPGGAEPISATREGAEPPAVDPDATELMAPISHVDEPAMTDEDATEQIAASVAIDEATSEAEVTEPANTDVVPAPRRFALPKLGRKSAIVLAALGGLLVLGAAGIAYATYDYGKDYEGRLLPGTTVAGVDVGGMSEGEAVDAVELAVRPQLEREIELSWEDRSWRTTPAELGARSNAEDAVGAALNASDDASFLTKARMRLFGSDFGYERDVAINYPKAGVRGFIEGLASSFDREPRDATIDSSTGWVEIVKEQEGRTIDVDKSFRSLRRSLRRGESDASLTVDTIEPEVTSDKFDKVLLVRIGENKLYLYEDGQITHTYPVATGQPEYPTPEGQFEIAEKRYLPTWINPDPEGWGADLPASIPPGEGNPLGLRALNWSAPLIRFHGTSATYSLGYNASHGCVRMANEDVVELYDMVDVGTPIVSVEVAPYRPLYVSSPDPVLVDPEGGGDSGEGEARNDPKGKDKKDE